MRPTAANLKYPLIRFLGKRSHVSSIDHTPRPHPMSPTGTLPTSFTSSAPSSSSSSASFSSSALKYTPPGPGELGSLSELPARFQFKTILDSEIEIVNAGGADLLLHQ